MRIGYLSKRDSLKFLEKLRKHRWAAELAERKTKRILQIIEEHFTLYKVHGFLIAERGGRIFPTVHEEYNREILGFLPAIVVDMGAVPYIVRGADVMRPGVREFRESFRKGEIIIVRDERNFKPLSISLALEDSDKCASMKKGKIAENLHHVNDKIWRLVQSAKHLIDRN